MTIKIYTFDSVWWFHAFVSRRATFRSNYCDSLYKCNSLISKFMDSVNGDGWVMPSYASANIEAHLYTNEAEHVGYVCSTQKNIDTIRKADWSQAEIVVSIEEYEFFKYFTAKYGEKLKINSDIDDLLLAMNMKFGDVDDVDKLCEALGCGSVDRILINKPALSIDEVNTINHLCDLLGIDKFL